MSINLRVKRKQIDDNAIGGEKIRLDSNQTLRSRNAANDGDIDILKVDTLDKIQLLSVPHVSTDPTEATQLARKGYVDQKIADLVNGAPELLDTLNELAQAIADDPNFATTVTTAVAGVQAAVDAEEARALAAEAALQAQIDALDSGLQDELDDTQVGAGLEANGSYVAPAVSNYLSAATSLKDADSKLDTQIKVVADDLAQEILDRIADVDAEEARAIAIETQLQLDLNNEIDARVADVDAEELRATNAENSIQAELDATQVGAGLALDGSYVIDPFNNYIMAATSLANADSLLDAAIKVVSDDLAQEILDRTADVDAEETRALAAEAALDARVDSLELDHYLFYKEKKVLTSPDLVYIDLTHEAEPNSIVAYVGRLGIHKDEDYTVSVVGGVSRLTWTGPLTDPGKEQLSVDDVVYVTYSYRV